MAIRLAPAFQSVGDRLHDELKEGSGKASIGRSGQRVHAALVVGQVALSLVLLVGRGGGDRTEPEIGIRLALGAESAGS